MSIRLLLALAAVLLSACSGPAPSAGESTSSSASPGIATPASIAAHGAPPPDAPRVVRAFTSLVDYLPPPPAVNAVDFVDAADGWVGGPDAIYATTDGGASWIRQYDGPIDVRMLRFIDRKNGFALGRAGLFATADGGAHWEQRFVPVLTLRSVDFSNTAVGWGVAGGEGSAALSDMPYRGGRLVGTGDGGRTWQVRSAPDSAQSVCFGDERNGWVGDANHVWRTDDRGDSWRVALSAFLNAPDRVDWRAQVRCAGSAVWVQFAAGGAMGTGYQVIYRSADTGSTWQLVTARGPTSPFDDAHRDAHLAAPASAIPGTYARLDGVLGPLTAYFSGGSNAGESVAITNDGGSTVVVGLPRGATAVDFADPLHGWAVVFAYNGEGSGTAVLATSDGGRSWHRRFPDSRVDPTLAVDFSDASTGWGLGTDDDERAVVRSRDGGETWEVVGHLRDADRATSATGARGSGLSFSDAEHGWATIAGGALQATDDGGATWRVVAPPGIGAIATDEARGVALFRPTEGAVLTGNRLLFTVDEGAHWTATTPPGDRPRFLSCIAAASCWTTTIRSAAAPVLTVMQLVELRRDGVGTIVPLVPDLAVSAAVIAVAMRSPGTGAVAAFRGCGEIARTCVHVLTTSDAGATWVEDRTGISGRDGDLRFLDADRGWLLTGGRLFRTIDGGLTWKQIS